MSDFYPESYGECRDVDCTRAVQKAIDEASAAHGRVVLSNGLYQTGSLFLKSNLELHVAHGSVLKASENIKDYFNQSPVNDETNTDVGNPVSRKPSFAYIFAYNIENLTISGGGEINGSCFSFVHRTSKYYFTGDFYPRPILLLLENVRNLTIKDIVLKDSAFWTVHMMGCRNVLINGITIDNPLDVANCDGIDPDHCQDVRIIGCNISCADDCICLKNTAGATEYEPTRNVIVSSCILRSTSAAIKVGTEGVEDFADIIVSDCMIQDSNRGISLQIRDQGNLTNAFFHHIIIRTRQFSDDWWGKGEGIAITSFDRNRNTRSGRISNVRFSDIDMVSENGMLIACDEDKIEDISFCNVSETIVCRSRWKWGVYDLRPGWAQGDSLPAGKEGVKLSNAGSVSFENFRYRFEEGEWIDYAKCN
jgi:polygalacturonase